MSKIKKIKILMVVPCPQDATSLYRGYGPFSELTRDYDHIELINIIGQTSIDWAILRQAHILFLQRGFTDQHLALVEIAKSNGLAVWVDYDDDLFSVPSDNPVYDIYNNPGIKKNIANIIANADFVSVSTAHLKLKIDQLNSNIGVIPNGINFEIFHRPSGFNSKERNRVVLWRGSSTHARDIMTFSGHVMSAYEAHKKGDTAWTWSWIGYNPWFLTQAMEENTFVYQPPVDTFTMFKVGFAMKPAAMHVPLHPNQFNYAKSNIALLEGALWGCCVICPDWEEWKLPGAQNYRDFDHYGQILHASLKGEINHVEEAQKTWEHVKHRFNLKKINHLRLKAAESLRETGKKGDFRIGDIG